MEGRLLVQETLSEDAGGDEIVDVSMFQALTSECGVGMKSRLVGVTSYLSAQSLIAPASRGSDACGGRRL